MLKLGQEVWVVIDALDECSTRKDSDNTQGLIAWIKTMVSSNLDNLHFLVTSREEDDIRSGFKDLSDEGEFISIEGKGLEMDIKAYVEAKITHSDELKRWRKMPEVQQNIKTKVLKKASGIGRPLGVEELVDAIAVNLDKPTPSFDPLDRMPEPTEIARYCSSLTKFVVKEDDQTTELHLAHFSVKEYLVSSPEHSQDFNEMMARTLIAKVCLSYLRHVEPDLHDVNEFKAMFPFAEYSAKNWMENAAATEKQNETVFEMTVDFLMDFDKTYYKNWTYLHQYGKHEKHDSPFWHACNAGLSIRCLERILEDGKEKGITIEGDEDTVMEYGSGEPLRAASERGHLETMRFLLEKGVEVEDQHFYLPCDHGDEEAVKLLLEYGEMNPWNEWGPEAFARACYNGHLGLVELLIDQCSDFVNISPSVALR
ncbi:nacht and ankyrin domain protein [Lasiodiplodia theobromae]|nr:nacht and ankyrin domain protein [Lasiodiplodia theobromae]